MWWLAGRQLPHSSNFRAWLQNQVSDGGEEVESGDGRKAVDG